MSRADELRRFAVDAAGYYYRDGGPIVLFSDASTIIRELEEQLEQMRDAHGPLCEDLNKATDRIVVLEAVVARLRPVVEAAVEWRSCWDPEGDCPSRDVESNEELLASTVDSYEAAKKGGQCG